MILALAAAVAAPGGRAAVTVHVTPLQIDTKIGHRVSIVSTIVNDGPRASGLIAHLNVLSVRPGVYVDPEDWSSHRTRYLRPLRAGERLVLAWPVSSVNRGSIGIYVTVLRPGGKAPATSPVVRLEVADRRTLDSGGILPLALAVPGALALLALVVRLRRQ